MTNVILSEVIECPHCDCKTQTEIAAQYRDDISSKYEDQDTYEYDLPSLPNEENLWQLLRCLSCRQIVLRKIYSHEAFEEIEITILYPSSEKKLFLPHSIEKAYNAANKVRRIDANAYAVLLGRVLDKVCEEKKAIGEDLFSKLKDLAEKGAIPQPLADMAHNLRMLRNIGAHADLGELTGAEIPILGNLCTAILEYIYHGPALIENVQKKMKDLKFKKSKEENP